MIDLKLNDKHLQIPSSWNDVTYPHYCKIITAKGKAWNERLSVYTGIELETINSLTLASISAIANVVSFMDMPETVSEFSPEYKSDLKISSETYGKLGAARTAIKNASHPILAAADIIKTYTGEGISDQPITKVMGQITFFLSKLESS